MSKLPKGWVESPLIDLAKFIDYRGRTPKKTEMGIPLITAKNIKNGFINREPKEFIAESDYDSWMTRGFPKKGDVLLTTEAPLGNVAQIDIEEKFALAQRAICFQFYEKGIERFLYYYLRSPFFNQELGLNSTGSTVKGIKAATLKKLPVHIAPLNEQKRIVEKLDEVLAQVDTIKARLDSIPAILKRFRQSVLAAAVSGKLTEEWRTKNCELELSSDLLERWLSERKSNFLKDQERLIEDGRIKRARKYKEPVKPNLEKLSDLFPDTWTTVSVSQFAECLDSSRIPVKKEDRASANGLYPYFGANGLVDKVDEYIFDDELVLVTEDETFYGRTKPIAYRNSGKCWVNNHAHVLRASTKAANDYLCYVLMYKNVEPWLSGSTGRAKLTQAALNEIPLGLPPEGELEKIVMVIGQYLSFADTIEAQVKKAQTRVDNLTQSILAKAFRGELVEQDPNDEPADKLLERITATRKEAEALAKAAKKAATKKRTTQKKVTA